MNGDKDAPEVPWWLMAKINRAIRMAAIHGERGDWIAQSLWLAEAKRLQVQAG